MEDLFQMSAGETQVKRSGVIWPPSMYGRVFRALQSMTAAFVPFATAIVGFVIEGVGLIPTVVGFGLVYVAITLGMLLNPALRRIGAAPPTVAIS